MLYTVDKIEGKLVELLGDDCSIMVFSKEAIGFKVHENDVISFDELTCAFKPEPGVTNRRNNDNKRRLIDLLKRK